MIRSLCATLGLALLLTNGAKLHALESETVSRLGIQSIKLLTDVSAITPGETFTVALALTPSPDHHTYWRGPGIVGVATRIDWTLPKGFTASDIHWPAPEDIIMAGLKANGFRRPVLLLTDITAPADLSGDKITLSARAAWMSCAISCNPGTADLSLQIPVADANTHPTKESTVTKLFIEARNQAPKTTPKNWSAEPRQVSSTQIQLDLVIPGLDTSKADAIHFYCDDLQVDSDEAQSVSVLDQKQGKVRITLARPNFGPETPKALSGVLYNSQGWAGLDSDYVEITASWPEGTTFR